MRDAPSTRFSLITRLRDANDHAAWTEFVALYEPAIYRFARSFGIQDADAREITQDLLLHVGKSSTDLSRKDLRSFRAWLAVVTRRYVIDIIRKRNRKDALLQNFAAQGAPHFHDPRDDDASIDDASIENEWTQTVRKQIFLRVAEQLQSSIDPKHWQAFFQTAVEMRPAAEVAQGLGMTVGNVYVARCRILRRIRHMVRELSFDHLGDER